MAYLFLIEVNNVMRYQKIYASMKIFPRIYCLASIKELKIWFL